MKIKDLYNILNNITSEALDIITKCELTDELIPKFKDNVDWNLISKY